MIRLIRGMRQQDLARLARVDQTLVSRLENGDFRVSSKTLKKIAAALGLPVSDVFPDLKRERQ
jgi:transcriptional regulator with XRE-family HTH domain